MRVKRLVLAAGGILLGAAIAPALSVPLPGTVAQREVKVPLACGFRVVRDHRGGRTTLTNNIDFTNTTAKTLPLGTPIFYTATRTNGSQLSTYVQLYVKLDPGRHYVLRITDLNMNAGCQAWILQKVEPVTTQ